MCGLSPAGPGIWPRGAVDHVFKGRMLRAHRRQLRARPRSKLHDGFFHQGVSIGYLSRHEEVPQISREPEREAEASQARVLL